MGLTSREDTLDLLHHTRVGLCPSTATPPPSDHRTNRYRLILPCHARLLSSFLHIELDSPPRHGASL